MDIKDSGICLFFIILSLCPGVCMTQEWEIVKSAVCFPSVIGDPLRKDPFLCRDPFSMFLVLSGDGGIVHSRLDENGKWRLTKRVGPFEDIDIQIGRQKHPSSADATSLANGGTVTQAISRIIRHEDSFNSAVRQAKSVWRSLFADPTYPESTRGASSGNVFTLHSGDIIQGGWNVILSVREVRPGDYEYLLVFKRELCPSPKSKEDIVIEVDI